MIGNPNWKGASAMEPELTLFEAFLELVPNLLIYRSFFTTIWSNIVEKQNGGRLIRS
jgi:hypothetical protein